MNIHSGEQKTPKQWTRFLSNGQNKENLLQFLYQEFQNTYIADVCFTLFVTSKKKCCRCLFSNEGVITSGDCEELFSDHEEADTRLILHALHASDQFKRIVIWSPDTDVAVIALPYCSKFEELEFATRTQKSGKSNPNSKHHR